MSTQTIWKMEAQIEDDFELPLPRGAETLSAGLDVNGMLCLWFLIRDMRAEQVLRKFHVYGTGNPIMAAGLVFIGTVRKPPFVWHVFEERGS